MFKPRASLPPLVYSPLSQTLTTTTHQNRHSVYTQAKMRSLTESASCRLSGIGKIPRRRSAIGNNSNIPQTTPVRRHSRSQSIAYAKPSASGHLSASPLSKALSSISVSARHVTNAVNALETDYPLFDLDRLGVEPHDREWFTAVNMAVRKFMNGLDASHNYQHIRRVVSVAAHILETEKKSHKWARNVDPIVVWVACMTHDVGDAKYKTDGETRTQLEIVDDFLKSFGCPLPIRRQAAYLASEVSFTAEMSKETGIQTVATQNPAFRIVQDADRLDGLGSIGVSRLFLYGGVNEVRRQGLIESGIKLIEERFVHYPRLMKTETGKKIAEERYKWMVEEFMSMWKRETDTSNV